MLQLLFILACVICAHLAAAARPAEFAAEVVKEFLGASDVKACLQNASNVTDEPGFMKHFERKTFGDVLDQLKSLAHSVKSQHAEMKSCNAVESDMQDLVRQMSSPEKLELEDKFREFEETFDKQYSQDERQRRFEAFTINYIHLKHLRRVEKGSAVYSHLTPFADLSKKEFAQRNGFRAELLQQDSIQDSTVQHAEPLETSGLPESFDWREKGAVNAVENQGNCGSCWAFATVANIEGAGFVENNKLLSLSEQELVDCDKKDWGCQAGMPSWAYTWMLQNNLGLETESDYPYISNITNATGTCKAKQSSEKVFIKGWVNISTDEDQIAAALIKYGPLAIGINANAMGTYKEGVADPPTKGPNAICYPTPNHGVALVGFGTDGGKKYWTIKNSWGEAWGEKGYYRIVRGSGACGLNTAVTSATGVTFGTSILV